MTYQVSDTDLKTRKIRATAVVGDERVRGVGGELAPIASASVPKASV